MRVMLSMKELYYLNLQNVLNNNSAQQKQKQHLISLQEIIELVLRIKALLLTLEPKCDLKTLESFEKRIEL